MLSTQNSQSWHLRRNLYMLFRLAKGFTRLRLLFDSDKMVDLVVHCNHLEVQHNLEEAADNLVHLGAVHILEEAEDNLVELSHLEEHNLEVPDLGMAFILEEEHNLNLD